MRRALVKSLPYDGFILLIKQKYVGTFEPLLPPLEMAPFLLITLCMVQYKSLNAYSIPFVHTNEDERVSVVVW